MHVAFGRIRRRIAPLRTGFSLMRSGHSEIVLHIHSTQVQIIGEGIGSLGHIITARRIQQA